MNHWLKPVQFVYSAENAEGVRLMGVVLPDYSIEMENVRQQLMPGEMMVPGLDFDYQNLLEGCRMISDKEWHRLATDWVPQENKD